MPLIFSRLALAALFLLPGKAQAQLSDGDFTQSFRIQDCKFDSKGVNPHFLLQPGRRLVLEGVDEGEQKQLLITVLKKTRRITLPIDGRPRTVTARIVEEREYADGELVEVSRNFFAICHKTGDVYYFGEEVDIYEDGEIVSHDGAWLAGQNGAQPGLIMPGTFLLGSRYFQEMAPGVAMDRAEHTAQGFAVDVPFGHLENCVEVIETTPLEPGAESRKVYCAGVGLVIDGALQLVDVIRNAKPIVEDDDDD